VINIPILFEDENFLVIDKPSGMVVNRSLSSASGTVQDWAEVTLRIVHNESENRESKGSDFLSRAGIVHRLDKETSGILIIAKTPQDFTDLQMQFFSRTVLKSYCTLVHGRMVSEKGTINAPVGRLPWDRTKFGVIAMGREAQTAYEVAGYYQREKNLYTLLHVVPHTGRTHQIRIHLKHIGFSVVGDHLYAGRKIYEQDITFCPRLFLHAQQISIIHPRTHRGMVFSAPLPSDLQSALSSLQKI
jgi:23S rRNA pseudouridine1911/1915/1917 synthase